MADSLQLLIKSAFDASGVTAATNSIKSIDSQINRVSRGFSQFMGLMGAGGIGAALFAFGKSSVLEFARSEAGIAKLTKAMQNLGTFTDADVKIQTDFAKQLQLTTKYSDDDIMAIQTQLVTYGLYGDKLKQATQATLDLAVKTGSTETASKLLGKAFQGQTDTLNRYGIKIDSTITGAAKFDAVLTQVQSRMGGMAAVEGQSFEGRLAILNNGFNELQESMGQTLMPVAEKVLAWAKDLHIVLQFVIEDFFQLGDSKAVKLKKELADINTILAKQMPLWEQFTKGYQHPSDARDAQLAARKAEIEAQLKSSYTAPGKPGRPTITGANPATDEEIKAHKLAVSEAIKDDKEYLRENQKGMALENEILNFSLTKQGQMYTRYFGSLEIKRRQDNALKAGSVKQLGANQRQMLADLERDYDAAGHTLVGGWKQAMDEMAQAGVNWKDNWLSVANGAMGGATEAVNNFFMSSSENFGRLDKFAKSMFDSILKSFLSMVAQMIAKWIIFKVMTGGMGMGAGVVGALFERGGIMSSSGPLPLRQYSYGGIANNAQVAVFGEGRQPEAYVPLPDGRSIPVTMAGGGGSTINQTINVSGVGNGNVREICRQIADAGRKGVTEALDAAKVLYKQGAKRAGETAL